MEQNDLLENEHIEKLLSPHPLSFMGLQSLCMFLIVWGILMGWFANFSEWKDTLLSGFTPIIFSWSIVLLVVGVIASLLMIRWRIFFFYLGVVAGGIGLVFWQNWQDFSGVALPYYTIVVSIIGFLVVELYRRSHKYIISNLRIVFRGGVVTKMERTLRYDKITDINSKQGILGQIFGFGTIIPISQSGFGLGSDQSFAAGGVELGTKKVGLLGIFGGGKEVQTPRARSYYELHGVHPYKEVKNLVENMVQDNVITPYQQEQVATQKEQVDIQKQMRDLLKKQIGSKEEQEEEESES
jgi:membrane protein YdbS with pleckstrin-like domain